MQDAADITGVEDRVRDGRPRFGADLAQLRARVLAAAVHRAPATVGRYEVGQSLGAGAFGTVYRAYDPKLGRQVAIKVVTVKSEHEAARVLREARMLATLSDPHVVDVFEVGLTSTEPPAPYVVMELVSGQTLKQWFSSARRPWRDIVTMLRQAALGLHAAHTAGIVHRDFKPANALIGDDGRLRVLDFGLARPFSEVSATDPQLRESGYPLDSHYAYTPEITPAGHVMGTPAYMAPEAFYGEFTPASDQYSLAVALYEGLFGRRPVSARSFEELRAQVTTTQTQLPRDTAGVPTSLCRVVRRALSLDPQDRFTSLRELVDALDAVDDPTRSPRRTAVAVGSLAVAGVLGWWVSRPAPCETGATAYDAARGDVVLPQGAQEAIARHRSSWIDAEAAICADAGAVSWNARRCLQSSLDATAHLVASVDAGDLSDEWQIARAFQRLPSPAACRTPHEGPTPSDAIKPAVADLERRLVELWAIETTRHFDAESLAFADKLAADAQEVGYAPIAAKAVRRHGKQLLLHARTAEALAQFERAYFMAQEAEAPVEAALAATEIFRTHATMGSADASESWRAHAQAAFDRAGIDPLSHATYADGAATLATANGDYPKAVATLQELLRGLDARGNGQSSTAADVTNRLGTVYYSMGDYAKAAEVFETSMGLARNLYGEHSARYAATVDNLGLCLLENGDAEGALQKHLLAFEIRQARQPHVSELGNSHGNLALAYQALERYDEALEHLNEAMWRFEAHWGKESPHVGKLLRQRGDILTALGPSRRPEARRAYRRALELFEASGQPWAESAQQMRDVLQSLQGRAEPA